MVFPNRSQFFEYESISFSCGHHGSSGWAVKRTLSSGITEDCQGNESNCVLDVIYPSDSGLYWCESDSGECSNAINITVTDGSVILESPVHPVMEGDHVTLRCRNKTTSSSSFTADFYKDGLLIGSSSTGSMTIRTASKSHEGSYRCNISGCEASADSWLTVTARPPGAPQSKPVVYVLLPVVGVCVLLALMLLIGWRCHKAKHDVLYTNVTITQSELPPRIRDRGAAKTFYSKVKPGST
ncbi:low affinity immunoglobulin gamma Fc region receptor II-like isoform X2 [Echeneis naucrates]|nr:low affinity immunoglobulin gamma Fc region receptor II-like isoform X2 [Echeneis naucrates]